jgi:hypothetical protein
MGLSRERSDIAGPTLGNSPKRFIGDHGGLLAASFCKHEQRDSAASFLFKLRIHV